MKVIRKLARTLLLAASLSLAAPAIAAGNDCPLARQPYSSKTLLVDLELDPEAKAALESVAPNLAGSISGGQALPPGFTTILTPEFLLKSRPDGPALTQQLDHALAAVQLTPAAVWRRCSRYDQIAPRLPATIRKPAILVFDKITGFRDGPSVDAATAALRAMAMRRGWTLIFSSNGAVFNPRDLARFDAVVWNNVSGDALTMPQRQAFRRWIEQGGGFAGMHGSGGDLVYIWDWYVDELIGARFIGHPMDPQFQTARVNVEDRRSSITRGLGSGWSMSEEWYSFEKSPRETGAHILATLDEASYSPIGWGGADIRMGDHPIAWTRCIQNGRSFYSAIGHRPESYDDPHNMVLLEQGIAWAAGRGNTICRDGREIAGGRQAKATAARRKGE